ncbi:hypothetical protein SISNIDRAFT_464993 [Sistotremastrum niveocremeum HHB9708]|uniref:Uncharacterized protein n=1 Tax=Sistotremastrum niveocremeum HHB9708 TaxID=1314777 RepID=A0A164W382_9AGAM|nr:hypothetical protein SISNIDRAFT_464993 [Sistotremastrum niveocremeum HHB9708]
MRRQASDAADRQRIETIQQCNSHGEVFQLIPPEGLDQRSSSLRRHLFPAYAIIIADSSEVEESPSPKPTRPQSIILLDKKLKKSIQLQQPKTPPFIISTVAFESA